MTHTHNSENLIEIFQNETDIYVRYTGSILYED